MEGKISEMGFEAFRFEVATMIVEELVLDDVIPDEIDPDAPLFVDGLGLDSIDALELSFAISKRYGIKLRTGDAQNKDIFASLNSLSQYIQEHRTR